VPRRIFFGIFLRESWSHGPFYCSSILCGYTHDPFVSLCHRVCSVVVPLFIKDEEALGRGRATVVLSCSFFLRGFCPREESGCCSSNGARRVLASGNKGSCLRSRWPCFAQLNHPRHLVPGWLGMCGVSEVEMGWC